MDNSVVQFRTIITDVLQTYYALPSVGKSTDDIEEQLIIDTERDHYQILTIGWEDGRRVYYPIFHLDVKDNKIWVQEDATDYDLVGELERHGLLNRTLCWRFMPPTKALTRAMPWPDMLRQIAGCSFPV